MTRVDWRRLAPQELLRQFTPRMNVPDAAALLAEGSARSAKLLSSARVLRDLAYGAHPLETLDLLLPARGGAPVVAFVHGGYWRALDKTDYAFVAEPFLAAGIGVAMLNYPLAPAVTLSAIVASVRGALGWLARSAQSQGLDAGRLSLLANSSGAHLAAMALATDWTSMGLGADLVKAAVLVSGIYDPSPVLRMPLAAELGLTGEEAARNNALAHPPAASVRLLVAAGDSEPPAWVAQSEAYHEASGSPAPLMLVPGTDHFRIAFSMADPAHPLGRAVLDTVVS